jgi:hypothetical protein
LASVAFSVFCFVRAIALSISSVPVAAPAPGHELRRHAHEKTRRVRGSAPASYDEGHQIGNTPRLAGLQISDYDACSLDIPAASPNFGVARVLIEEQKTIRKIGIELQLAEPLIGSAALLSNTRP